MKLAIVTAFPPSNITLNEYAFHLVKHFSQKEEIDELVLLTDVTDSKKIPVPDQGCKITVKPCWSFNSYTNLFKISKAINESKPDAVLFNLQFMKFGDKKIPAALGLFLPLVCKLRGIPNIALLHNILEEVDLDKAGFTSNRILQKLYGFIGTVLTELILQADIVAVTMEKYVQILKSKYKADNVVMIPHGTFEIPQPPSGKLPAGPFKIMAFGKFGTYKKVEILIEAVEKLRKSAGLNLELVIAGTDNPNARGYLKNVQEQYSHIPQLIFTGYVEEHKVESLFKESAVVAFPYTSTTGSSGVLHQAGSYGKAVIMPNLGDLKLLVKHEGYRGEFFEPDNISSLAASIKRIICNASYRNELAIANYSAAKAFSMTYICDIYLQKFINIITRKQMERGYSTQNI